MDQVTPPPTPPQHDSLPLAPPFTPPASPLSDESPPSLDLLHTLIRPRCDSEKTLLDEDTTSDLANEQGEGEEEGIDANSGIDGDAVRVTVDLRIRNGNSDQEIKEKIERAIRQCFRGVGETENKGEKTQDPSQPEVVRLEEELKSLRRKLERSKQSIRDLRWNNSRLRSQANEAIEISLQAEGDLEKVLEAVKVKGECERGKGGGNWAVVKATIENLRERREAREIEDLKAEVVLLNKQLTQEREKLEELKKGGKESDRKAIEKDIVNLEKQYKRAQEDIATLTDSRDSLKKQVSSLQNEIEGDSRLVALREELKVSKELANKHSIELKAIEEESRVYKERCHALEAAQKATEGEKEQIKTTHREKRQLEKSVERLEKEKKELERTQKDLVASLEESRKKIVSLESHIKSLEQDNADLVTEKDELAKSMSNAAEAAQAKPFSRLLPSLFGASEDSFTVEKELKKENKELKQNLASLEKRYQVLNEKKGFSNDSNQSNGHGSPTLSRVSVFERYSQLLENLSLTEDDVNLLLSSGPFYPPVREQFPESSILDHLWLLTDLHSEFEQEKSEWETQRTELENQVEELKSIGFNTGDDSGHSEHGKGWQEFKGAIEELEGKHEKLSKDLATKEAEAKEFQVEQKKKEEVIAQLEARIQAYEEAANNTSNAGNYPRSPAPSVLGGTAVSAASTFAVKSLVKTISDLNDQLATCREENTSLLLKLVSSD
ncbi:uncharacterized protein JCM6883_005180 [Sporobolomyces salmoneus]|uniref:uncharacterized protein n=1 Tax=Sporobolomyces salmoneus TaxID=183962 RepID=UPI003173CE7C